MIKLDTLSIPHTSDLSSYANPYSMAGNKHLNSRRISGSDNSDRESSVEAEHDQSKPKKVRLPSISSIASSLRQPITINTNSPSLPTLTYNQRAHSNPELNNLHVAAEIFTKNNDPSNSSTSSQSEINRSQHPSPVTQQQQHVVYFQAVPPQQQQPVFPPPQFHQLPPPQGSQAPVQTNQPFPPFAQHQPHPYYMPGSHMEQAPHYTTTTQHHLSQHHQIKPKRTYTRRLSKFQQENKLKPPLFCQRCGITETPEWRKGPNGARTLCNACGLFHAKILKRDGPEAAANAINSNKVIKKNAFKRRSSVNDAPQLVVPHFNQPSQQLHISPPMYQQPQPGAVILPPGNIPQQFIAQPPQQLMQHHQQQIHPLQVNSPHPLIHTQTLQQQQQQQGVILSPISPSSLHHHIHHHHSETIRDSKNH